MGKRLCPLCFVRVPWTAALAHSYGMVCPGCRAELELSRFTRVTGALCGIFGAWLGVYLGGLAFPGEPWALRVVQTVLAYGVFSTAGVLGAGDLAVRPKSSVLSFPHAEK